MPASTLRGILLYNTDVSILLLGTYFTCALTYIHCRFTALHYAVESNSTVTVEAFGPVVNLSHLPDANEGRTPLMIAAQNASHKMLEVISP